MKLPLLLLLSMLFGIPEYADVLFRDGLASGWNRHAKCHDMAVFRIHLAAAERGNEWPRQVTF